MTARRNVSALDRLAREPERFGFDAAARLLLLHAGSPDPAAAIRFRSSTSLAQPPADVVDAAIPSGERPVLTTTVMGLIGPSGALPRGFTELVQATLRNRSRALHEFLDVLSQLLVGHFASARTKYRPHRMAELAVIAGTGAADPLTDVLLALTGYANGDMADRLEAGIDPLCHYAGFFAMRPRSADRLAALASDWCGRPVEVQQFAGAWLAIPRDQRTVLAAGIFAGRFDRLGVDAAIGVRAWDAQARINLRIGPLDLGAFSALLPDRPLLGRLASLVRAYLGFETGFAINPVLDAAAVPDLRLPGSGDAGEGIEPRLGWNTWLAVPARRAAAHEAVFDDELIEGIRSATVAKPR